MWISISVRGKWPSVTRSGRGTFSMKRRRCRNSPSSMNRSMSAPQTCSMTGSAMLSTFGFSELILIGYVSHVHSVRTRMLTLISSLRRT